MSTKRLSVIMYLVAAILSFGFSISRAEEKAPAPVPETLEITSPTGGVCRALYVEPGQRVQHGERLVAVGPAIARNHFELLRTELQITTKKFEESRTNYLKTLQDFQRGDVVTAKVEQAQADMTTAGEVNAKVRTRIKEEEFALQPQFLYSPADATVKEVRTSSGKPVSQNDVLIILKPEVATPP